MDSPWRVRTLASVHLDCSKRPSWKWFREATQFTRAEIALQTTRRIICAMQEFSALSVLFIVLYGRRWKWRFELKNQCISLASSLAHTQLCIYRTAQSSLSAGRQPRATLLTRTTEVWRWLMCSVRPTRTPLPPLVAGKIKKVCALCTYLGY